MTTQDVCELLISNDEQTQFKQRPRLSKKAICLSLFACGVAVVAVVSTLSYVLTFKFSSGCL